MLLTILSYVITFFTDFDFFLNILVRNESVISVIYTPAVYLLNFVTYGYVLLKFFKVLCYSKMTFEWLPMINPFVWPFSFFHLITGPYFAFWSKALPSIKLDKSSVEISGIVALEILNSFLYFLVQSANALVQLLEKADGIKF
jgi:hypothetical protein